MGLTPIFTDAAHFVRVLEKNTSRRMDTHLPDARLDAIPLALMQAQAEHTRLHQAFDAATRPEIVYYASYQDGLIHAFERILSRSRAGEYAHTCDIRAQLQSIKRFGPRISARAVTWMLLT